MEDDGEDESDLTSLEDHDELEAETEVVKAATTRKSSVSSEQSE